MQDRRTFFKLWAAGLLALTGLAVPLGRRTGRVHLVNGWVLTDADLARLGLDDL